MQSMFGIEASEAASPREQEDDHKELFEFHEFSEPEEDL